MNKKMRRILMVVFVSAISVVSLFGRHNLHSNNNKETELLENSIVNLESLSTKSIYAGINLTLSDHLYNSVVEKHNLNSTGSSVGSDIDTEDKEKPIKVKMQIGWASTNIYVFSEPSLDSLSVGVIEENSKFFYTTYNEEWVIVKYNKEDVFIQSHLILDEKRNYTIFDIPEYEPYKGFKSWMPYTSIHTVTSRQYKLQQMAYTGDYGIRMYDGRYCIAVGTAITSVTGTYIDIILENGTVIECIVGDIKADIHTESMNIFTSLNNCCSEFIIDKDALYSLAKIRGDISCCREEWNSKVVAFKVYDINVFDETN